MISGPMATANGPTIRLLIELVVIRVVGPCGTQAITTARCLKNRALVYSSVPMDASELTGYKLHIDLRLVISQDRDSVVRFGNIVVIKSPLLFQKNTQVCRSM